MTNNVYLCIFVTTSIKLIMTFLYMFQSLIGIDVFIMYHYCPTNGS